MRTTTARRSRRLAALVLMASICCGGGGCTTPLSVAGDWVDPLGLTGKKDLSQQPAFREQVENDPFPSAGRSGILGWNGSKKHAKRK